jgi:hypothetical protein
VGDLDEGRGWIELVRMSTSLDRLTKRKMSMRTGVPKQAVTAIA